MFPRRGHPILSIVLCLAALAMLFGFANAGSDVTEQSNKARIAVGTIKAKADGCSYDTAAAVGEMLATALSSQDKFIVLASQEEVAELIDEIELGESDYVESGRGPDKGLMEGADLLVTGAVTAFEPDSGGGGGGLGGFKKKAFGKVGVKKKSAKIILDIKLIDIRTRRVLDAKAIEAKSSSWGTDIGGGGWANDMAMTGALGVYSNEPMEKAVRAVLVKTVERLADKIPNEYYRYQGDGQYTQEYAAAAPAGGAAPATSAAGTPPATSAGGSAPAAASPPAASVAEDMTLYTRYDFVPGNKVLFYDDMSLDEEGEFPYRWGLEKGVFEVARLGRENWILCTDNGTVLPKLPAGGLPERFTIELEYYDNGPEKTGNYFYVILTDAEGENVCEFGVYASDKTWLTVDGKQLADKRLPEYPGKGVHTLRAMISDRSIKAYVDHTRIANVPKAEGFAPHGVKLRLRVYNDPENPTLFRGLRVAEGGKTMREQLDESGKVITHGILFDSGSSTIKAESYRTLKEIARLLEDDPDLRLCIDGHTDADGSDGDNLVLSQRRADATRSFLISTYAVSADRLETRGYGESEPIDGNESPEGKANNRRVELVKI